MDKKCILLLLEIYLLKKRMQCDFNNNTLLDFRAVVSDLLVKCSDINDFCCCLGFFSVSDDKDFSYLLRHFRTYVRSFFKVLDKK